MKIIQKIIEKAQYLLSRLTNGVYEWYLRRKLKNRDFTILCSNCIGGMIYHRLGLQFQSPTINLWTRQRDFMKLAADPALAAGELNFIESAYDYPVAELNGITIYFNHSKSEHEARQNWERRAKRINQDNLFLIMYDRENMTEAELRAFGDIPCRGRLVPSDKSHPDIPYVVTIKPTSRPNGQQFLDKDWLGFHTFEKQFDFVKWLNQK